MTRRHDYHHRGGERNSHDHIASLFPNIMELAKHEGNHAVFVVERPEDDHDETRSFSADALDAMHTEIMVFVVSRVMRSWDEHDHAPKRLAVDVRVRVT